ncbi:MAG: hypothetical protein ACI4WS_00815 [Oscillospiraceae bacterium]
MSRKITAAEFFEKNNAAFMKFGRLFTRKLTDEELISALAEKDLEKLAKVFRLVFEMLSENSPDSSEKLSALITAYSEISGDGEQD